MYCYRSRGASAGTSTNPRLDSYIQLLEKMSVSSMVRTLNADDLQQVRHAASRILSHVGSLGMFICWYNWQIEFRDGIVIAIRRPMLDSRPWRKTFSRLLALNPQLYTQYLHFSFTGFSWCMPYSFGQNAACVVCFHVVHCYKMPYSQFDWHSPKTTQVYESQCI